MIGVGLGIVGPCHRGRSTKPIRTHVLGERRHRKSICDLSHRAGSGGGGSQRLGRGRWRNLRSIRTGHRSKCSTLTASHCPLRQPITRRRLRDSTTPSLPHRHERESVSCHRVSGHGLSRIPIESKAANRRGAMDQGQSITGGSSSLIRLAHFRHVALSHGK